MQPDAAQGPPLPLLLLLLRIPPQLLVFHVHVFMLLLLSLLSVVYLWLAERDPRVACLAGWMDRGLQCNRIDLKYRTFRGSGWRLSVSHSVAANKTEE